MTKIIFFLMIYFIFFLFRFSVHFDLFIKKNALRSKSLFDDLFQTFFILFRFILKKMHYDKVSIRSTFVQFFDIFDSRFSIFFWQKDLRSKSLFSQNTLKFFLWQKLYIFFLMISIRFVLKKTHYDRNNYFRKFFSIFFLILYYDDDR